MVVESQSSLLYDPEAVELSKVKKEQADGRKREGEWG
jgi:hypothetical protein